PVCSQISRWSTGKQSKAQLFSQSGGRQQKTATTSRIQHTFQLIKYIPISCSGPVGQAFLKEQLSCS
ncbi:hypothetical protein ACP3WA_25770, partial [Salmonella enterica]|uniref:hypothetical protein n=1 Tax=Salmonella enterica TaxID=28901 RepID=UPI003CEC67BF